MIGSWFAIGSRVMLELLLYPRSSTASTVIFVRAVTGTTTDWSMPVEILVDQLKNEYIPIDRPSEIADAETVYEFSPDFSLWMVKTGPGCRVSSITPKDDITLLMLMNRPMFTLEVTGRVFEFEDITDWI